MDHVGDDVDAPDLAILRAELPEPTWTSVSERLALAEPPSAAPTSSDRIEVPYAALRRFLEDPMQGWAEHVLRLREDDREEDPFATENERFRTDRLAEQALLLDVFLARVAAPELSLDEVYFQEAELRELSGVMPTGVFQTSERRRHQAILEAWDEHLRRAFKNCRPPLGPLRFGRAREHARVRDVAEPVRVSLGDGRVVELYGTTSPLIAEPASSFIVRSGKRPTALLSRQRIELRSFLDHALLAASGRVFADGYHGYTAFPTRDDKDLLRVRYDAFTPDEAQAWLAGLLAELLDDAHAYRLPFETSVKIHEAAGKGPATIEEILANAEPSPYGPLLRGDVPSPAIDAAVAMVERRVGPFFARRGEGSRQ